MATRVHLLKTQLTRFTLIRWYYYYPFSTFPNESHILNQLSHLFQFKNNIEFNHSTEQAQVETKNRDSDKIFDICLNNGKINNRDELILPEDYRLDTFISREDKRFNICLNNGESNTRDDLILPEDNRFDTFISREDKRFDFYLENKQIETRVRAMGELLSPEDKRFSEYSESEEIRTRVTTEEDKSFNLNVENGHIETRVRVTDELLSPEDKRFNEYSDTEEIGTRDMDEEDKRLHFYSETEKMGNRVRDADEFLSPEDKLRGVFLQKIRGKSAIENALSNVGVEMNVEMLAKVVDRGNIGGEAIVTFFNWAVKQPGINKNDICCYHIVLKALGRRKMFDYMMAVLRDMTVNGIRPDLRTIEVVMDSFIRVNHVAKATQILGSLEEFGMSCDVESLNVLVRCLCKRSHVGAANALVNKMKGKIVLNKESYDLIISGWSRVGKIGEMETNLKEMLAGTFEPDCLTFSYLIEGLGRAHKMGDAVEVFEGMSERGCVPDARVYNAMILNFVSVRDFDKAVEYYRDMVKNECEPNMETYVGLVNGFLKARKVADAVEMFDEMLARGLVPSPGTVTSFIEPLCTYGPPHAALMIYKKATKARVQVSLTAYKLLLMRLSRFGKCGMLLNMWDDMQKSGYSSDKEVYEYIINGLSNVGQLENAILVMEECIRKGFCPSKLICSKLNHKLMSSDKVESAYKLFLKVRKARFRDNESRVWRARGWHF